MIGQEQYIEIYQSNSLVEVFVLLDEINDLPISMILIRGIDSNIIYTLEGHIKDFSMRGLIKFFDTQEKEVIEVTNILGKEFTRSHNPYWLGEEFAKYFNGDL